MRRLLRGLGALLAIAVALAVILYVFGPYEESDLSATFDETQLEGGVAAHFAAREARYDDITPGTEKQVIWTDAPEARTEWVVLYLHGFSATSMEIRPVPDRIADALGANLILTRLAGHGRGGAALAQASVSDWMADVAEALAAARKVGDRILVVSVSTGGTLAAAAAMDPVLSQDVAGIVFISPNFGINNPAAPLLTLPAARTWVPLLAGQERSWEPHNPEQGKFWTTRYPTVALLPVAALVQKVVSLDLEQAEIPALFLFSQQDEVVVPARTQEVADRWGGPVEVDNPVLGPQGDPSAHVIAGDILSPDQTEPTVRRALEWIEGL